MLIFTQLDITIKFYQFHTLGSVDISSEPDDGAGKIDKT